MRQRRRTRWVLGALGGLVALVATTGSSGCDKETLTATSAQPVVIQVLDNTEVGAAGVEVTAWIVDVDSTDRAPIVVGTGVTDGEGIVEFSYVAANQPYVCGYEVREMTSLTVLARSPAAVSNHLSSPSGLVTVALP